MATDTLKDIVLTTAWQEITATVPQAASVDLTIQNIGNAIVQIAQGGSTAPTGDRSGYRLAAGADCYVNNAKVWARAYSASGGLISLNPL